MNLLQLLAEEAEGAFQVPWYHGIQVLESTELFLVVILFFSVLVTVYYIQRWIGDY